MTSVEEITELKIQVSALSTLIEELRAQIARQQEQITALLKENQELKEKLGTNSSNSSLPPSQDLHKKKQVR